MSLFRKPRRRPPATVAKTTASSSEDEEDDKQRAKSDPRSGAAPRPLLSFADEVEDDSNAFRVKKSSYSKKLQKRKERDKLKHHVDERDDDDHKNSRKNDNSHKKPSVGMILSGREAFAAGLDGDMSDSDDEENNKDIISRFKPMFRSKTDPVRELLDKGVIPDAAMIHAARKKRQQAREISDFIPVDNNVNSDLKHTYHSSMAVGPNNKSEGRLVREDGAGDGSDEDPDRIDVKGVAPETSRKERIQQAKEEGPDSDLDSDGEEWETQQIRKAVTQNQIIAVQQENYYSGNYVIPTSIPYSDNDVNPFSVAPAAVVLASFTSDHLKPLATETSNLSINQLTDILQQRLNNLSELKQKKVDEISTIDAEISSLYLIKDRSAKKAPALATRFEFYQKLRGYLTDLIECLDEKLPVLTALETRALALQKRKASFLCERRRADIRDQAQDILQAAGINKKDPDNEERRRRCAEREGRRLRRRRIREQLAEGTTPIAHRDGDSSDDEIPQTELTAYETTQEQILADAADIFSDTLEEFSSLAGVLSYLEDWKQKDSSAYIDAYVSMCIPRLAAPFLRLKLLLWNPIIDHTAPNWEKMQWYRGLMLYSLKEDIGTLETEESLALDPDIFLIPNIIQKVILPKLADIIEGTWDPMSTSQTRRLVSILKQAGLLPGAAPSSQYYMDLAKAVLNRIKIALQHDVFIPILPKSIVDSGPRSGSAFLKRQAAAGSRLLNNLVILHGSIADNSLIPLVLEALLQRYLLAAIRCSPPAFSADLCLSIATSLPKIWLEQENSKPPLQQFITCCQEVLVNLTDNPLNLKYIEQIRSAISILLEGN